MSVSASNNDTHPLSNPLAYPVILFKYLEAPNNIKYPTLSSSPSFYATNKISDNKPADLVY